MSDEQTAVGVAVDAFAAKLENATVDWRAGVVTSAFVGPGSASDCPVDICANDRSHTCRNFTRDLSVLRSHFTVNGPSWIGAGGTCGRWRR